MNNNVNLRGYDVNAGHYELQKIINQAIQPKPESNLDYAYDYENTPYSKLDQKKCPVSFDFEPLDVEEEVQVSAEVEVSPKEELSLNNNNVTQIAISDLSATMVLEDVDSLFKKMTAPLAKTKEEKRVLQAQLDEKKSEIVVLETKNADLQKIIDQLNLEAEETAKKHDKVVNRLVSEQKELLGKIESKDEAIRFRDLPARSPVETKEVLAGIFKKFSDLKICFEEGMANLPELSSEEKTNLNSRFVAALKEEKMKVNVLAKEVEILFTAQAYTSKDKDASELRPEMFKLWNDTKMLGYELRLASIQLEKAIALPKIEAALEEVKNSFENEEDFKTLRKGAAYYPALTFSYNPLDYGYHVDTHKLGKFDSFVETIKTKFDQLNKIAFKQEAALIEFHKDFQLVKHTDSARRLAASDFKQADANEIMSNEIHNKYQANLKVIHEKSMVAWNALSKAQNEIHEKLAIIEFASKSPALPLPSKATLDDTKTLKYEAAALI